MSEDKHELHLNTQAVDEMVQRSQPLYETRVDTFARLRRALELWANPNPWEVAVEQFTKKQKQYQRGFPDHLPPLNVVQLRRRLVAEEMRETLDAFDAIENHLTMTDQPLSDEQLALLLDGLCDSIYVVVGTAIALGLPLRAGFEEVHRSNMTKDALDLPAGERYGLKGGIKGANFSPADLVTIIRESKGL